MSNKIVTYTIQFCCDCYWKKEDGRGTRITSRCGQVRDKGELRPICDIFAIPAWCPLEDVNEDNDCPVAQ